MSASSPRAILAGRYRVERVIGRGGMGVVVKAMHIHLKQPVAIKLLLPRMVRNAQIVQRFLREAQLASRLKSEHIARVTDVGRLDSGAPFMVLEYLEGMDLLRFSRSPLTICEVIDLVLQACEALAEAHSLGIVHRDIKLANLFVTQRADHTRLLKVLDFGTSKSALGAPLTMDRTMLGTPAYMSPEQIRSSRSVDPRSDIWSLGVVLYRLLKGALPFDGDSSRAVAHRVLHDPLPDATTPLAGALDEVIARCLEKDPARRFQNVAELAHALAPHSGSETEAAISAERTRRTLGNVTLELAPPGEPACDVVPRALGTVDAAMASEPGGVRWSILAVTLVLACAVGATTAIVTRNLQRSHGTPPAAAIQALAPASATRSCDIAARCRSLGHGTQASLRCSGLAAMPRTPGRRGGGAGGRRSRRARRHPRR